MEWGTQDCNRFILGPEKGCVVDMGAMVKTVKTLDEFGMVLHPTIAILVYNGDIELYYSLFIN